jgi:hypothetical protein
MIVKTLHGFFLGLTVQTLNYSHNHQKNGLRINCLMLIYPIVCCWIVEVTFTP